MAKPNKVKVNWRIEQAHLDKLKQLSEDQERPMSYFVDKALEAYLQAQSNNKN